MDHCGLKPPLQFTFPERRDPSRSPSRSPVRRRNQIAHELDPLLADLSPTSTLEALESTDAVVGGELRRKGSLIESVAGASATERAWGIKAALAGKMSREWYREVAAWPWPTGSNGEQNGFAPLSRSPYAATEQRSKPCRDGKATVAQDKSPIDLQEAHCGSLPLQLIEDYESRIETIREDMDTLELEELKDHVRASHLPTGSRRPMYSQADFGSQVQYAHMDDFTAIVTATIMQTLPDISRLNNLLNIWSVRLLVLRQVPDFLDSMDQARTAMKSAWNTIDVASSRTEMNKQSLNREAFVTMRYVLENHILDLGQRLDYMLDALEGRQDTIPDAWIEYMEAIEANFGTWVVEAERRVLDNELEAQSKASKQVVAPGCDSDSRSPVKEVFPVADGSSPGKPTTLPASSVDTQAANKASESSSPTLEARVAPEANQSEQPSTTVLLSDSERISSHLKKLLLSREASTGKPDSPFGLSPPPSPSRKPKVSAQSNDLLESLAYGGTPPSVEITDTVSKSKSSSKPAPLFLSEPWSKVEGDLNSSFCSDASYPGSATSDYFSDMSSPEIQHASRAEYFGAPVEVTTPGLVQKNPMSPLSSLSRHSSQRTERGRSMSADFSARNLASPVSPRSRASTFVPEDGIPEDQKYSFVQSGDCNDQLGHSRTKSASMQSLEPLPRTVVGNYDSSHDQFPSLVIQNQPVMAQRIDSSSATSPTLEHKSAQVIKGPPTSVIPPPREPSSTQQMTNPTESDSHTKQHRSIPTTDTPSVSKISRNRFEDVVDFGPGTTPVKIRQRRKSDASPPKPNSKQSSPSKNNASQLEARISSILTEVPVHIKLTSGPEEDAPEVRHPGLPDLRDSLTRQTLPRFTRAQTSTPSPSMTLAPAQETKSTSRRQSSDAEAKVYHLHQSGKEAPIKLFVRLVGETGRERVMVRIGGGWADLSEYLKEYAAHHGKRSVSDSRFAIQELPSSPLTSSPAAAHNNTSASSSRPTSSSSHAPFHQATTPITPETYREFGPTAASIDSDPAFRPNSRHSIAEDGDSPLGAAGPKAKKPDLSPGKQAWVDGMLDQARNKNSGLGIPAENINSNSNSKAAHHARGGGDLSVGELGKVGGTRRVFLRSKTTTE